MSLHHDERCRSEIRAAQAQAQSYARDLKDVRVMITGARGYLGGALRALLHRAGADVTCVSRQPHQVRDESWIACDYLDRAETSRLLRTRQPEVIFNMAGFASAEGGLEGVRHAIDGNALTLVNLLLAAAATCPDARIVTAGTLETADPERAPVAFSTPYGGSKAMADVFVQIMHDMCGMQVSSAHIGMTYGPGDPNGRRLVPAVIRGLLTGKPPLLSSGRRLEDWVYIDDVVAALVACVVTRRAIPAAVDVATGTLSPLRDVVEAIATIMGVDAPLAFGGLPDRPGGQRVAHIERTRKVIGWMPQVSLPAGLRETVRALTVESTAN